jgi:hypothetical protein
MKLSTKGLKTLHGWLTVQWALHLPVVVFLYIFFPDAWEKASILYLALVSIYANAVGHFGAWQATRTEVKQDES